MPIHVVRSPMKLFWPVLHCLKRDDIREATLAVTGLMEYNYFGPKGKLPYLLHPANWVRQTKIIFQESLKEDPSVSHAYP